MTTTLICRGLLVTFLLFLMTSFGCFSHDSSRLYKDSVSVPAKHLNGITLPTGSNVKVINHHGRDCSILSVTLTVEKDLAVEFLSERKGIPNAVELTFFEFPKSGEIDFPEGAMSGQFAVGSQRKDEVKRSKIEEKWCYDVEKRQLYGSINEVW